MRNDETACKGSDLRNLRENQRPPSIKSVEMLNNFAIKEMKTNDLSNNMLDFGFTKKPLREKRSRGTIVNKLKT